MVSLLWLKTSGRITQLRGDFTACVHLQLRQCSKVLQMQISHKMTKQDGPLQRDQTSKENVMLCNTVKQLPAFGNCCTRDIQHISMIHQNDPKGRYNGP